MNNNWNTIDVTKVINNDSKEITKTYNMLIGWLLFITNQNEELSNDIFMKIMNKMDRFDNKRSKLHNFIYTIGMNETASFFRLKNKNKVKLIFDESADSSEILDEEYVENEHNTTQMDQIFSVINEDDKQTIISYLAIEGKIKDKEISKNFSRLKKRIKKNLFNKNPNGQKTKNT